MSSGFSGEFPDFFNVNGGGNVAGRSMSMMNVNNVNRQVAYRSQVAGILSGESSDLIGKRTLAEFQLQNRQQASSVYLRNVKQRSFYYHNQQASPMEFLVSPENSSISDYISPASSDSVSRYDVVSLSQQLRPQSFQTDNYQINDYACRKQPPENIESERSMMNRLQELEKELFLDEENDAVSVVTDTTEWSETTIRKLVTPAKPATSSTSSSASSSVASPPPASPKQLVSDLAKAIADGESEIATELLTRLDQSSNARGTPEQKLGSYMVRGFRSRVNHTISSATDDLSSSAAELFGREHILSTQLMYDKSPCFKLAFMAANDVILQAFSRSSTHPEKTLHVVDFDIGHGLQYVYLLHAVAAARKNNPRIQRRVRLTTFTDFGNGGCERLKRVGDGLESLSNKLGEGLKVENDDVLAVNFAFKLNKLPDESVTTDNLRDEVLRRVKAMSPAVVTVAEQELNGNTASFAARVNDALGYYGALLDSVDSTIPTGDPERVRIEEGLSRRVFNSVACEGKDRVERCEVFGKWRARMTMAGLVCDPVSRLGVESLRSKVNSGTRGNPGFTVEEDSGGIRIGWLGRTLNVVSAWH
ncbi:hypothetical protein OSB04_026143 [Centaurea solstitialis]|uniref:Scarecrow-like protein 8 n=1 Tax=Centaurea solstitialis TaxID=347529 RepID=A0AA38SUV8_9ASTR|nr:hypothetical protein OSB04_026143 [Centaurea solstitialis]